MVFAFHCGDNNFAVWENFLLNVINISMVLIFFFQFFFSVSIDASKSNWLLSEDCSFIWMNVERLNILIYCCKMKGKFDKIYFIVNLPLIRLFHQMLSWNFVAMLKIQKKIMKSSILLKLCVNSLLPSINLKYKLNRKYVYFYDSRSWWWSRMICHWSKLFSFNNFNDEKPQD